MSITPLNGIGEGLDAAGEIAGSFGQEELALPLAAAGALAEESGVEVTFRVHGAEGSRTYHYYGSDAAAILAGADPSGFSGERVD